MEGYDNGAVRFLHKPINPVLLRPKVAVFADLHHKTRDNLPAHQSLLFELSGRKRTQEELRLLGAELEDRVEVRTRERSDSKFRCRALAEGIPGIGRYELARSFRCDPASSRTFFIAIPGYARESDFQRSLELGFAYHFAEPVTLPGCWRASASKPAPHGSKFFQPVTSNPLRCSSRHCRDSGKS